MRFMLDTTALNIIIKDRINTSHFKKEHEYFITPVQYSEMLQTTDKPTREKLVKGLVVMQLEASLSSVQIHSAPWGHFPWGHGPWGGGDGKYYDKCMNKLLEYSKGSRGNNCDALIIEACGMNGMTLVTADTGAQKVCADIGIDCIDTQIFLRRVMTD